MAGRIPAPVRRSIAVAGGSFFVALALLLDALLWLNATSLRGTVNAADYRSISPEAVAGGDSLGLEPDIPEDWHIHQGRRFAYPRCAVPP